MDPRPERTNPNTPEAREAFYREMKDVPAERLAQIRAMIVTTPSVPIPVQFPPLGGFPPTHST